MVADIESGCFENLLLTPARHLSLLIGAKGQTPSRMTLQVAIVLILTVAAALHFETGIVGAVLLVLTSSLEA